MKNNYDAFARELEITDAHDRFDDDEFDAQLAELESWHENKVRKIHKRGDPYSRTPLAKLTSREQRRKRMKKNRRAGRAHVRAIRNVCN